MTILRKHKNILLKISISLAIMAVLLFFMDFSKFTLSIGEVHWSAWLIAAFFIFSQVLALSYRWQKLVNIHKDVMTFQHAVKINLASIIANYFFLTSIGGIVVRVAMTVKCGIPFVRSVAATILDRLCTVMALFVLSILFSPIWSKIIAPAPEFEMVIAALISLGLLTLIAFFTFEKPRRKIIFFHRKISMCFQYLRSVLTKKNILAKVVASSLLGQLSYFCAVYFIIHSMNVDFSPTAFLAIVPFVTLVASIPIGWGGWGIREGAYVYGLGLINIPMETAFAASVQIGFISMLVAIIAGLPVLLSKEFKKSIFGKNNGKRPDQ